MSTNRQLKRIKCCGEATINLKDTSLKLNQSAKLQEIAQSLTGKETMLQTNNASIQASSEIRANLKTNFQTLAQKLELLTDKGNALKTALVQSLASSSITLSDEQPLLATIDKMLNSNNVLDIKKHIMDAVMIVEEGNNRVFANSLLATHKNSSIKAGFSKIQTLQDGNTLRLIAENDKQQLLISEITVDTNSAAVHAETETIGFEGKECEKVMEKFDEALKEAGIIATHCDKKPTEGQPVMQFAKQLVNYKSKPQSKTGLKSPTRKQNINRH